MTLIGCLIFGWFLILTLLHLFLTSRFVTAFSQSSHPVSPPEVWPPVLAVMALRGGDESLDESLSQLMSLDYPDYQIRIVVDSETDPAIEYITHAIHRTCHSQTDILPLTERRTTCSGKISRLLCGTENVPAECQIVAIFDGDTVLHKTALKELVVPLLNGAVLTTGNRWYSPSTSFAGMTRFLWNGLAVTMMNVLRIPWGGCVLVQREMEFLWELVSEL